MKNDFIGFKVINNEFVYTDENPVTANSKSSRKNRKGRKNPNLNSSPQDESLRDKTDSELFTIDTQPEIFTIDTQGDLVMEEDMKFIIDTVGERKHNRRQKSNGDFIPLNSKAKKKQNKIKRSEIEDDYIQNAEFDLEYLQNMKIVDFNDFYESNSDESEIHEEQLDSDDSDDSDVYSEDSLDVPVTAPWEYDEDEFHERFNIKKHDPFEERLNGEYASKPAQNYSKSQLKKQRKKQQQDERKHTKKNQKEAKSMMDNLVQGNDQTKLHSYIKSQQDRIKQFVRSGHDCFITDPMPKELRHTVQGIAKQFNTTVKVIGKQDKKMLQIFRKSSSFIPDNIHYELRPIKIRQKKKEKVKKKEKNVDKSDRIKVGDVVGQHIKPIDSGNVGHMMMQMMGWQGGGLKEDGIVEPIQVVVRSKRTGLGGI
ncbi:hypothetical protein HDV01_004223 [Terramyces sp. JEL0728]|nr:hypothetical protein HDV01_004223 [Terramyces sp. JEL0728]